MELEKEAEMEAKMEMCPLSCHHLSKLVFWFVHNPELSLHLILIVVLMSTTLCIVPWVT